MDNIRLFRKRFIPEEIIELKNDNIIHFKDNIIITKWDVLKPRHDINNGISAYFINDGIKVSKIFNEMAPLYIGTVILLKQYIITKLTHLHLTTY